MTVVELIHALSALPPELPVYVLDDWFDFPLGPVDIENVREAENAVTPGDGMERPRRLVLQREP